MTYSSLSKRFPKHSYFCGWYYRCQSDKQTLAIIPSVHKTKDSAFCTIQVITDTHAFHVQFPFDDLGEDDDQIRISNNRFGKQIFKNVLGKTQAEVKEKLKRALEEAKKVDFTRTGKYTVEQWMDEWFENVCKIKVRPSSHQTYRGYIDHHVAPNIGKIPLEKLSTMDLQKLYRKLMNKGRVERIEAEHQPKGLSAKTVRNINQVISSAMDFAVAQKIISENPCKAVALPKLEHKEMQTIPAEQLQAFLQEAKATGVYEMYYIELATGLRRGELLGLKWTDIDWKNGIIKVRRQVARVNGKIVEAPLKTKNSYRAVSISPQAIEVLREQKRKTNDT